MSRPTVLIGVADRSSPQEDEPRGIGVNFCRDRYGAKARNAIAVTDRRDGEVYFVGEVESAEDGVRRIAASYDRAHFCYEVGPIGCGMHRLITSLGDGGTVTDFEATGRSGQDQP